MSQQSAASPTVAEQRPRHIAVIMDGNGRWAQQQGLPREEGHRAGVQSVRAIISASQKLGISALTLFAFSSENWKRPEPEVTALMALFLSTLALEQDELNRQGVRLRIIGERSQLPQPLQDQIDAVETLTANNTGFNLSIATNYGGQWDITQACRKLAIAAQAGQLDPETIDAELLSGELALGDLPAPELMIRTGGESRISNFLLWQLAYTELYFTDTLWPEFGADQLAQAVDWYSSRLRRFGQTSEQLDQAVKNA